MPIISNFPSSGIKPEIIVTPPSGATYINVTAQMGESTCKVQKSGNNWIVSANGYGECVVTAAFSGGSTNTVTVTIDTVKQYTVSIAKPISKTLNDNDWSVISEVSASGKASNYWSVGDCKAVHISGTVGTLSINQDLYVYILGFNHNGSQGIDFGTFKTAATGGVDVCPVDNKYNSISSDGTKCFNMNHWGSSSSPYNTNYGGWKGCDARYDVLGSTDVAPSGYGSTPTTSRVGYDATTTCATSPVSNTLMAALPFDLRAVMKPMTIYTDNVGNSSNVDANVTASVDYLPLLAEFEIFGSRSVANQYEQNKQAQYAYYAAGNSKIKYRHSATSSTAYWWERSAIYSSANTFCYVNTGGSADYHYSRFSFGLAPAFRI